MLITFVRSDCISFHFPDLLLAKHVSILQKLYLKAVDMIELSCVYVTVLQSGSFSTMRHA
jgi:hypothetical protein